MKLLMPKLGKRRVRLSRKLVLFGLAIAFLGGGALAFTSLVRSDLVIGSGYPEANRQYAKLVRDIRDLQDRQQRSRTDVVPEGDLQRMLSQIQLDLRTGELQHARNGMRTLQVSLAGWERDLNEALKPTPSPVPTPPVAAPSAVVAAASGPTTTGVTVPIVLYHDTPANFDDQLVHLEQTGYTVIDLDQLLAGMRGGPLPAKPVVLTFDDGFANQMQAFEILKRHDMKATFYIINGGEASRWCIGAGRRYHDPLQPAEGCGDAYLNWDQIREMDRSGLITIGGHTMDHENLTTLPRDNQNRQIAESKAGIERELGHSIRHLAYPLGAYDDTSIEVAREAGYATAVTVAPGTYQAAGTELTLRRIRDAFMLP